MVVPPSVVRGLGICMKAEAGFHLSIFAINDEVRRAGGKPQTADFEPGQPADCASQNLIINQLWPQERKVARRIHWSDGAPGRQEKGCMKIASLDEGAYETIPLVKNIAGAKVRDEPPQCSAR